jgi:DNA invertase Pin-like site-specific DNA recombinase
MGKKAFGYVRVSTDMQAQYGLSLDAQKEQIAKYAEVYGYEVIGYFVDHDSAKSVTGRPEYQKMIGEVSKGKAQYIIASALDRFSRSQRDFLNFQEDYVKAGRVHLILIKEAINTEQASTTQFLGFLVAFAQMERERTSERVKGIISYIRSQGGHYGKVPFGYTTVNEGRIKRLVPHPENHKWLEQMAGWYRQGVSFDDIAQRLNENGVKPSQSQRWTKTSVYDLLCKEKIHVVRSEHGDKVYDREKAYNIAYSLKSDGRTHEFIAEYLNRQGLRPSKASEYRWYSVQELLRSAVYHDRSTAVGCAKYWKAQGKSLREIALKLQEDGHKPKRGGQWFAQQVKQLLIS